MLDACVPGLGAPEALLQNEGPLASWTPFTFVLGTFAGDAHLAGLILRGHCIADS